MMKNKSKLVLALILVGVVFSTAAGTPGKSFNPPQIANVAVSVEPAPLGTWTNGTPADGEGLESPALPAAGTHEEASNMEVDAAFIPAAGIKIDKAFCKIPLYFVENQGQQDERVAYYVQGMDKTLYFAEDGVTIVMNRSVEEGEAKKLIEPDSSGLNLEQDSPREVERWVLKLDFVEVNTDVFIKGEQRSETVISYFHGKPEDWKTGVPTYTQLVYENLWEGIDLVFSGTMDQLKYEFRVQPGADPEQIQLAYRGAEDLRINSKRQLEVETGLGTIEDEAPIAWQEIDGEQVAVDVGYLLEEGEAVSLAEAKGYAFQMGAYDLDHPLIIDPAVIVYAGFIGGSGSDRSNGIAVDASGAAYVVGHTQSDESSFPVLGGPDLTFGGDRDAFVAKVSPDGSELIYIGYIGGSGDDWGLDITVDASGAAYVTGIAASDESSFPVLGGPDLTYNGGDNDVFVAKVLPDGSGLVYAGYIGGSGESVGLGGIAVDASGAAYVVGGTTSDETSFPVLGGPDLTFGGGGYQYGIDAFIAKVLPDGSGLQYAGYIGGSDDDGIEDIAVDSSGAAYVVGATGSDESSFPVLGGPDLTYNGEYYDAFVVKVKPDGSGLAYAGYIGGSGRDIGKGIAIDSSGAAYITGFTDSDERNFPVLGGPDLTYNNGGFDAFVAKVQPDGSGLVYAGYIGGSEDDEGVGIAIDSSGAAYVVGATGSDENSFPVIGGPDLTYNGDFSDAFIAKVKPDGSGLHYAGYIGGSGDDWGGDISVDYSGMAYIVGYARSDEASFPVLDGPDLTYNGDYDAFVAKISEELPVCYALTVSHTGSGSDPVASPTKSQNCENEGEYNPGESISLTATPAENWMVGSWTGTNNDSDSYNTLTNTVAMPSGSHSALANYIVPPGAATYENTDPRIKYEGGWIVFPDTNASGGSSNITDDGHYPSASFTFTGTRVSLIYKQSLQRSRMNISIDGNFITTLTQYGEPTIYQKRWDSPFLEEGMHEIVFSHDIYWSDGGRYSDIDAIIISTPERIPPAATTLVAATGSNLLDIDLSWIAPGDDGNTGTATEYLIRYAFDAIDTEAKWEAASDLIGEPAPQVAGTAQSMIASGMLYDQPYYFAIRTVDEIGNISDLSNSPSATAKAPVHLGVGTYQNTDPNIYYTGDWTIWNDSRTSGGNTQYSISTLASASFKFTGSRISVIYTKYSTRGGMYVYIDNNLVGTIDQYGDSLSFQNRWDSPIVSEGNHSVRLVNPEPVNNPPYYVEVDAIIVSNPESIPPAATNLSAISGSYQGEVDLNWNAPGDDGNSGTATEYIIRYAQSAIDTQAKWEAATDVLGEPTPQAAGTAQSMTISGLTVGEMYYFALRAVDEVGNTSDLSNSPSATAMKPDPVLEGTYENDHPSIIYTGNWSIESNDIASGGTFSKTNDNTATATLDFIGRQVVFYYIRDVDFGYLYVYLDGERYHLPQSNIYYSSGSTTTINFRWISPVLENGIHTIKITYLADGDYNNIDAFTVIETPDTEAPAAVNLSAVAGSEVGEVNLHWNAPGNDGDTGTAAEYIIHYSTSAIDTEEKWNNSYQPAGDVPIPQVAGTAQSMIVTGLQPGQSYYFALRTLDEWDHLSDLSNSPSVEAKSPDPVGAGTYENEDPNIVYTGDWTLWNSSGCSDGSERLSNDPDATATLSFTGSRIELVYSTYSTRGGINIVIPPNPTWGSTQYSPGLIYQVHSIFNLGEGTHTIQLQHPGGSKYIGIDAFVVSTPEIAPPAAVTLNAAAGDNIGEVDLDWIAPGDDGDTGTATEYFVRYASSIIDSQAAWDAANDVTGEPAPLVAGTPQSMTVSNLIPGLTYYFALRTEDDMGNISDLSNSPSAAAQSPIPVSPGTYQNGDLNIIHTGNWTTWNMVSASGGSTQFSNDTSATASLTFTGHQVSLLYTSYTSRGNIEIKIDDDAPITLNQYSSNLSFQNRWDSPILADGTHTVVFSHPGGVHYIDLDAIVISDPEYNPPATVTLTAATGANIGEVDLSWIAPGDDDNSGTAAEYIIRYARGAITSELIWNAAKEITGEPFPLLAGTPQSMTVSDLPPGPDLYFSIRTKDDYGNLSDLSNSPSVCAKYLPPVSTGTYENDNPNIVLTGNWNKVVNYLYSGGNTAISNDSSAKAVLTFTGDQITIRFSRNTNYGEVYIAIDGGSRFILQQYGNSIFENYFTIPVNTNNGTIHSVEVFHPGGSYYINLDAIEVRDPEVIPPAAVTLNAVTGSETGEVNLDWIAPGDDGDTGTATEYIIRYADTAIDSEEAWDSATDVTGEPAPQVAGSTETLTLSGLTPGQTYFFALRTLDDSGNLSDLSNSPSAEAKPITPVEAGTYEQNDVNIRYTGNWTTWTTASASGGSTRYSNDPAATATLTFSGRQISLLFTRYTTRGNIEITIDGGTPVLVNQYGGSLTFQNRWDSSLMDAGTHTVELRHPGGTKYIDLDALIISSPESDPPAAVTLNAVTGSSTGEIDLSWVAPGDDGIVGTAASYTVRYAAAAIDTQAKWDAATDATGEPTPLVATTPQSMTVSGLNPGQTYFFALRTLDDSGNLSDLSNSPSAEAKAPTPVEPGTYQETDANIVYTGNWTTWNTASASGGSTRYSNDPAASATLTFSGRQVSLLYTRYASRGNIEITIDGGTPVLLNQYGAALSFQNRWDSPMMADGTHTIVLRHPGGTKYIDLDALIVSSPESDPPAAVTLNAVTGSGIGEVDLNWIAPGDDGDTGTAVEYILRYAASAIDSQAKWDAATNVSGEPAPQTAGTAESLTISGLIPGQTYFFALRTMDDSGNLSDLSNSPSAEVKAPTPVEPGIYQENDANIVTTGNWTNWTTASASGGSTRYSNDPAASATLTFSGRQVSLLYTRYTSRGNIEITIDGGTPILLTQYGAALSFQNRWDSPLMADGTHTIVLRHPGGSKYIDLDALIVSSPESDPPSAVTLNAVTGSGTGEVDLNWIAPGDDGDTGTATEYIVRYASSAIDTQAAWDAAADVSGEPAPQVAGTAETLTISGLAPGQTVYFALRTLDDSGNLSGLSNSPSAEAKAPTPVGEGVYQENDGNIAYTGNWTSWSHASASGGAIRYTNQPGASATLTFTGRQVSLIFTRYTSRGNIEIIIDGGTPVLLNQYGAALSFQNRWDSPALDAGTHTIVLRHPGGTKYIDIDAIEVRAEP